MVDVGRWLYSLARTLTAQPRALRFNIHWMPVSEWIMSPWRIIIWERGGGGGGQFLRGHCTLWQPWPFTFACLHQTCVSADGDTVEGTAGFTRARETATDAAWPTGALSCWRCSLIPRPTPLFWEWPGNRTTEAVWLEGSCLFLVCI